MLAIWAIVILCISAVPALAQQEGQLRCAISGNGGSPFSNAQLSADSSCNRPCVGGECF
jgi:hypothetical protein